MSTGFGPQQRNFFSGEHLTVARRRPVRPLRGEADELAIARVKICLASRDLLGFVICVVEQHEAASLTQLSARGPQAGASGSSGHCPALSGGICPSDGYSATTTSIGVMTAQRTRS